MSKTLSELIVTFPKVLLGPHIEQGNYVLTEEAASMTGRLVTNPNIGLPETYVDTDVSSLRRGSPMYTELWDYPPWAKALSQPSS